MPISYERCPKEVEDIGKRIIRQHHHDLKSVEVRVAYIFARAPKDEHGRPLSPAVTVGGYPCAAKVSCIPLIQRADGRADAEIVIDEENWDELTDTERDALIDHELYHLEPQRDEDGNFKSDDIGRPKLKLRKHDHQFGWFNAIADRHGDASYEVKQAKSFANDHGQSYFGWATPPSGGSEQGPAKSVDDADVMKALA